jgi:NAD(P)-dependent dehydrogenase (short-subunit alcohol dehydrogenase family)
MQSAQGVAAVAGLLAGDVAVVTGAAQGNGATIAKGLAAAGAAVAVTDLNAAGAAEVAAAIAADGGRARSFTLDVTDAAQCRSVAAAVEAELGPVSILINNAGIVRRVGIEQDGFLASVKDQHSANVLGSMQTVSALLGQLTRTRGRIVNVGSIASFQATTGGIGYGASKGAVLMMTKAMASELAPRGIRVNGIAPGVIATPMTAPTRANADVAAKYLDRIPLKRFGETEDLVGPVLFLVSRLSAYVTGAMLPVDGGYLAV